MPRTSTRSMVMSVWALSANQLMTAMSSASMQERLESWRSGNISADRVGSDVDIGRLKRWLYEGACTTGVVHGSASIESRYGVAWPQIVPAGRSVHGVLHLLADNLSVRCAGDLRGGQVFGSSSYVSVLAERCVR